MASVSTRDPIQVLDSDDDEVTEVPSRRLNKRPTFRPFKRGSKVKDDGLVVDLTRENDVDDDTATPPNPEAKSAPVTNAHVRTHTLPRPPSAKGSNGLYKALNTMPAIQLSDDEDELPDDRTPRGSLAQRALADFRNPSKVAPSSNLSQTLSPDKRTRGEGDAQRQILREKRRRMSVRGEDSNLPHSPANHSAHPGKHRENAALPHDTRSARGDRFFEDGMVSETHVGPFKRARNFKKSSKSEMVLHDSAKNTKGGRAYVAGADIEPQSSLTQGVANSGLSTEFVSMRKDIPDEHREEAIQIVAETQDHTINGTYEGARAAVLGTAKAGKKKHKTAQSLAEAKEPETVSKQTPASPSSRKLVTHHVSAGATPSDQLQVEADATPNNLDAAVHAPPEPHIPDPDRGIESTRAHGLASNTAMSAPPIFPVERQVERVLGKFYQEMREDTEYFTKAWMKRSRNSVGVYQVDHTKDQPSRDLSDKPSVASAVFSRLRAAAVTQPVTMTTKIGNDSLKFVVDVYNGVSKPTRSYIKARFSECDVTPLAKDVPEYAHYVSLRTNILAPNATTMAVWPYFGDGEPDPEEFDNFYHMDTDQRHRKIGRLLEAQKVEEYIDSVLLDLGITWDDVLHFLLEPDPDVGNNSVARAAVSKRDAHREDFPDVQGSKQWTKVLSALSKTTQERLTKAAILCDNFQRMAKFPLWHVARRSTTVREAFQAQDTRISSIESRICRVCLQFNCHQHGELQQSHEDNDSGSETDDAVAKDILYPPRVNFRKRMSLPHRAVVDSDDEDTPVSKIKSKTTMKYWDRLALDQPGELPPFYPCDHPGMKCIEAGCSCFQDNRPCEKACSCTTDCVRKFQGCSCITFKNKRPGDNVCWRDDRCICYMMGRECDPDLCGTCDVCDVLDPVHRHDHGAIDTMKLCHNASIQKAIPKHTLLGDSEIHGMGLYAGQHIKIHEFIGEYKGEIITKEEADRRGAVHERQKSSYLFSLNSKQEVDSNFFGNKIRFINHRNKSGANVYPLIRIVNTVHRIGLYAQQEIKPGEELFFDYGPQFPEHMKGGTESAAGTKSAPHVRNASMVLNDFYDVEDDEDEVGNRRAVKAATKGKIRSHPCTADLVAEPPKPKKQGGARPGAGRKPGVKKAKGTKKAEVEDPRTVAQDRIEAYYVSQDKDLDFTGGEDGDDEDFVEEGASELESSDDDEVSEEEPVIHKKGGHGRLRGRPRKLEL